MHTGHIYQHICFCKNNCLLFILIKAFIEPRKRDLRQQLFISSLICRYYI